MKQFNVQICMPGAGQGLRSGPPLVSRRLKTLGVTMLWRRETTGALGSLVPTPLSRFFRKGCGHETRALGWSWVDLLSIKGAVSHIYYYPPPTDEQFVPGVHSVIH